MTNIIRMYVVFSLKNNVRAYILNIMPHVTQQENNKICKKKKKE
jgi:hypothetical protein